MEKPHPRAVENPEKSAMSESQTPPLTAQEKCKAVLSVWTEKTSVSAVCRRYSVRPPQVERWELLALEGMLKALEARPRGRKALEMKENSLSSHLEKLLDRKMLQNGKRQARKKEEKLSGTHLEKLLDQAQRPCRRGRPPKNESRGQSLPSAEISQ